MSTKSAGQQSGQQQTDQDVPSVRGRAPGSVQEAPASMQQPALQSRKVPAVHTDRPPAAHTYANYSKWDKFDPDAADGAPDQPAAVKQPNKHSSAAMSKPGAPIPRQPAAQQASAAVQQGSSAAGSRPAAEATALKDRGNKLFQAGYYDDAVGCYTQSIALQPTSLAYANRAMAQLKLGKPAEAEHDCSAALQLDSSYIKALHRRGTARRQLGRLLEAASDFEEALRLEPGNATVQADRDAALEQYLQRQKLQESSAAWSSIPVAMSPLPQQPRPQLQQQQQEENQEQQMVIEAIPGKRVAVLDNEAPACNAAAGGAGSTVAAAAVAVMNGTPAAAAAGAAAAAARQQPSRSPSPQLTPTAAAAAAAAALAARRAASLKAPKTGNEFEAAWRSFKGDVQLQAKYMALMSAQQLPTIFKTSLTAPMLRDILTAALTAVAGSAAAAARSDTGSSVELSAGHAAGLLQQLPKLPRFDMTAMCLTHRDKAGLRELWDAAAAACSPDTAQQLAAGSAQADVARKFIITPVNGTVTLAQVNAQVKGIQFITFTDVVSWSRRLNASLVDASTIAVAFTTNKTHGLVNKLEIEGTANVTGRIKGKRAPAVGTIINATQVITVAQPKAAKPRPVHDATTATATEVSHRYNQVYRVWQNRSSEANATYTISVAELNNLTSSKLGGPRFYNKLVLLSISEADSTKANIAVAADGLSLTVSPVANSKGRIKNVIPIVFEGVANGTVNSSKQLVARGGKHQPAVPPAGPFNATGLIELLLWRSK
ncbi:hypothetical protein COO60DRAFT_1697836 [Scenedesmus sp. NREL 46B-D3]|nr:hypothetical protein COO60DRAFT_1697836 [Scenedesmus sp. NREL 46B-D3]